MEVDKLSKLLATYTMCAILNFKIINVVMVLFMELHYQITYGGGGSW